MREKTYTRWVWNEELQDDQLVEYGTGKYHFDEEDKIAIVSEYVGGHVPASQIIEKYHISSRQVLFNWMDKYVNEKELVSLQDETNPSDPMAKKSPEDRVKELEAENKKLQKALELEKLRSKAYDTMINVAEETFNIPIRKKSGAKQWPCYARAPRKHLWGLLAGCLVIAGNHSTNTRRTTSQRMR